MEYRGENLIPSRVFSGYGATHQSPLELSWHILAPAFRKKALILKDEKLIREVDDFLESHKVEE
jgi:hypothetical protein